MHGGVYVPVTIDTQPNPYLEDPLRDIKVNDNLQLTKVITGWHHVSLSRLTTCGRRLNTNADFLN